MILILAPSAPAEISLAAPPGAALASKNSIDSNRNSVEIQVGFGRTPSPARTPPNSGRDPADVNPLRFIGQLGYSFAVIDASMSDSGGSERQRASRTSAQIGSPNILEHYIYI